MKNEDIIVLVGLAVLMVLLWRVLHNWARREVERREEAARQAENWTAWVDVQREMGLVPLDTMPDAPLSFGYKIAWLAVKCDGPEQVITVLKPQTLRVANWETGLAHAGVFVSPVLDGWVLVVDDGAVSDDAHGAWERLVDSFPEVQLYASHRVSDYYRWERYVCGRQVRCCCYADGEVREDIGPLTAEEQAVMLKKTTEECFPDEEDVLDIAAAWGVDPRFTKRRYLPSVGWLCTF